MVTTISPTPSSSPAKPNPKTSSQRPSTPNPRPRPPLERSNGLPSKKPKSREITSRYLSSTTTTTTTTSSSSSRRCPSPISTTPSSARSTTPLPAPKRAQSVDRRRPITPRPITPLPDSKPTNAASKLLTTRSLSVSFQGESFSLPISKTKATAQPPPCVGNARKTSTTTPERRRSVTPTPLRAAAKVERENSKPSDQHRWPRTADHVNSLTRSVDFGSEKRSMFGSMNVSRALQQSMVDFGNRRASFDGRVNPSSNRAEESVASSDQIGSDTDSVSSGSNSSSQDHGGIPRARSGVPARFLLETNSRMRRLHEPSSPLSSTPSSKVILSRKCSLDSPLSSPRSMPSSRTMSSPLRGSCRPASPSKFMVSSTSSPSRGMPSPSRARSSAVGVVNSHLSDAPCILSSVPDFRRGKIGENQILDAHFLRLLYNRYLQWRLVNARADAALLVQRLTAEKILYNAWVATSELQYSVTVKRIKLQLLRQNSKLTSLLKGQITYLEEWAILERDYSSSLANAVEVLEAGTLRIPVVGGARADIQKMKDAIGSAVDVIHAMASSLCSLPSKVEEMNLLMGELEDATTQERALLVHCRDLLSVLAAMQVKDCSLRTHILQVTHVPKTSLTMQI